MASADRFHTYHVTFLAKKSALLFIFLTVMMVPAAKSAVSGSMLECVSYFSGQEPNFKYIRFQELLARHFGPHKSPENISTQLNQFPEEFSQSYKQLSETNRQEILAAIKLGYAEATQIKNSAKAREGVIQIKRAMDAILNLEIDAAIDKVRSLSELETLFRKMNLLLSNDQAINFDSLFSIARHFQLKLNQVKVFIPQLKQIKYDAENTFMKSEISEQQRVDSIHLIEDLEKSGTSDRLKVWIYGSVPNGRGLKGISDLDYFVHNRIQLMTYMHFKSTDGSNILEESNITQVSPLGIDPFYRAPETLLFESRWVVEVTPTEIIFLVRDSKTRLMRRLP